MVVQADALGYLSAAEGTILQSVAAHQAAAHVAAGQEDHLSLQTHTRTHKVIRVTGESTSTRLAWMTRPRASYGPRMYTTSRRKGKRETLRILTPVSMQTTHSELPGPSTGLGADGVTGVPGV